MIDGYTGQVPVLDEAAKQEDRVSIAGLIARLSGAADQKYRRRGQSRQIDISRENEP
jgi:hypothetical protein